MRPTAKYFNSEKFFAKRRSQFNGNKSRWINMMKVACRNTNWYRFRPYCIKIFGELPSVVSWHLVAVRCCERLRDELSSELLPCVREAGDVLASSLVQVLVAGEVRLLRRIAGERDGPCALARRP